MSESPFQRKAGPVRVSYLVTTRNRASYLEKTLANVREFIASEDELILVDAASTDNTREVAEANSDIVNVFVSERDRGEAHGFNKAFMRASGRWIKVLTDDDIFYPEAMRQAIAYLEANPELDALLCGGEKVRVGPDGEETLFSYSRLPKGLKLADDYTNALANANCGLGLWLKPETIAWAGLFDSTYLVVDSEYMTRLIRLGADFRYLDIKLYRHFVFEHSGSGQRNLDRIRRDYIRIHAEARAWNDLLARYNGFIEPGQVGDALELPLSASAMELLRIGVRLRASGPGRLCLKGLGGAVRVVAALAKLLATARLFLLRRGRFGQAKASPGEGEAPPLPEIEWTGEVR